MAPRYQRQFNTHLRDSLETNVFSSLFQVCLPWQLEGRDEVHVIGGALPRDAEELDSPPDENPSEKETSQSGGGSLPVTSNGP